MIKLLYFEAKVTSITDLNLTRKNTKYRNIEIIEHFCNLIRFPAKSCLF